MEGKRRKKRLVQSEQPRWPEAACSEPRLLVDAANLFDRLSSGDCLSPTDFLVARNRQVVAR